MTSTDYKQFIQQTITFVRDLFSSLKHKRDASHGIMHFEAVATNVETILKNCEIYCNDLRLSSLAIIIAWLHDVADHKYAQAENDQNLELKMIEFLKTHFTPDDQALILHTIDAAGYSTQVRHETKNGSSADTWFQSMTHEQKLLRDLVSDADKLEAIGRPGLLRCIEFTRHKYPHLGVKQIYDHVVQHSKDKLLRLAEHYIYTPHGKVLAKTLHDEFVQALEDFGTSKDLSEYLNTDALNIEGCRPAKLLSAGFNYQPIWCNLVTVLDCPLKTNIDFKTLAELRDQQKYLLLENTIDSINEHRIIEAQLLVVAHYVLNASKYVVSAKNGDDIRTNATKNGDGDKKIFQTIAVHFHQDTKIWNFIRKFDAWLHDILLQIAPSLHIWTSLDAKVNPNENENDAKSLRLYYYTDDPDFVSSLATKNFKYEPKPDILISLSQCAGLNPVYEDGDLLYPTRFIPLNMKDESANSGVQNHFSVVRNDMFSGHLPECVKNYVNKYYVSDNITKKHNACLQSKDFFPIDILVVDKLWNPNTSKTK